MLVLYAYHFLVRQQRVSLFRRISELTRFSSGSVWVFKYGSVLIRMGPDIFFIQHQFNVTLAIFGTNFYFLVSICTALYLWLSHVQIAERSMVYHIRYSNLCIPPLIISYSSVLIGILLCVEVISPKYRVYCRKYLGSYSYCSKLGNAILYNSYLNTSLSSRRTSCVVYFSEFICSASYCAILEYIDQY